MARSTRPIDSFDDAFDDLFAAAYGAALDVLGDEQEAEDVAVEATARAYARWRSLERREWRTRWVVLRALMLALDVVKHAGPAAGTGTDDLDDPGAAPGDDLNRAVAELPRREREVIALRDLAGLSTEHCAEVLRVSVRTVSGLEARGRTRLTEGIGSRPVEVASVDADADVDDVSGAEESGDG